MVNQKELKFLKEQRVTACHRHPFAVPGIRRVVEARVH